MSAELTPDLAELQRLLEVARDARGLERIMRTWDRLAREAIDNLPALLDAAAERDALAAQVAAVRALHRPAYNDAGRTPICETCHGKAGVHECGCWSDEDYQPVCAVCNEGHKGMSVAWPCPTIRALDGES